MGYLNDGPCTIKQSANASHLHEARWIILLVSYQPVFIIHSIFMIRGAVRYFRVRHQWLSCSSWEKHPRRQQPFKLRPIKWQPIEREPTKLLLRPPPLAILRYLCLRSVSLAFSVSSFHDSSLWIDFCASRPFRLRRPVISDTALTWACPIFSPCTSHLAWMTCI